MVCRDSTTHKAKAVNPLIIQTPDEKAIFAVGQGEYCIPLANQPRLTNDIYVMIRTAHKDRKQARNMGSLSKTPPSSEEAQLLHDEFLRFGDGAPTDPDGVNRVWMEDTKLESVVSNKAAQIELR